MRIRSFFALAICLFIAAPAAFATVCDGQHMLCGSIFKLQPDMTRVPAPEGTVVQVCDRPDGLGTCYAAQTACDGATCNVFQTANAGGSSCTVPVSSWWLMVNTPDGWGGNSVPVWAVNLPFDCSTNLPQIDVAHGPAVPTVTSPANNAIVSTSPVNIRFFNGLTAQTGNYPAAYEVYLKRWPTGTTEPSSWGSPIYNGGQCAPIGSTTCSVPVTNPESGNYRVKVVVKLDVSSIAPALARPVVLTNSTNSYFWINTGRCLGCH